MRFCTHFEYNALYIYWREKKIRKLVEDVETHILFLIKFSA
jgi:hypothetical protein